MTRNVHFVGSIGLDTAEDVFAAAGERLGSHLPRCPDGEVGGRRLWISYQYPVLRSNAALRHDEDKLIRGAGMCAMRVVDGVKPDDIHFGELGYAREAKVSYQSFLDARNAGKLKPSTRFQVAVPTPFAIVGAFVVPEDVPKVLPSYTKAMLKEVERTCAAIPHKDLAIQWDVCIEMIMWDGRFPAIAGFSGMEHVFTAAFRALGDAIPLDVQLGIHICYGDMDAKHFVDPVDLGKAVELTNLIARSTKHRLDWVHMPVPKNRDDAAYFAPLSELKASPNTELFLGLVHDSDGVEGTRRRIAAAAKTRSEFGIATECGMARARTVEQVDKLLRVHAEAAS